MSSSSTALSGVTPVFRKANYVPQDTGVMSPISFALKQVGNFFEIIFRPSFSISHTECDRSKWVAIPRIILASECGEAQSLLSTQVIVEVQCTLIWLKLSQTMTMANLMFALKTMRNLPSAKIGMQTICVLVEEKIANFNSKKVDQDTIGEMLVLAQTEQFGQAAAAALKDRVLASPEGQEVRNLLDQLASLYPSIAPDQSSNKIKIQRLLQEIWRNSRAFRPSVQEVLPETVCLWMESLVQPISNEKYQAQLTEAPWTFLDDPVLKDAFIYPTSWMGPIVIPGESKLSGSVDAILEEVINFSDKKIDEVTVRDLQLNKKLIRDTRGFLRSLVLKLRSKDETFRNKVFENLLAIIKITQTPLAESKSIGIATSNAFTLLASFDSFPKNFNFAYTFAPDGELYTSLPKNETYKMQVRHNWVSIKGDPSVLVDAQSVPNATIETPRKYPVVNLTVSPSCPLIVVISKRQKFDKGIAYIYKAETFSLVGHIGYDSEGITDKTLNVLNGWISNSCRVMAHYTASDSYSIQWYLCRIDGASIGNLEWGVDQCLPHFKDDQFRFFKWSSEGLRLVSFTGSEVETLMSIRTVEKREIAIGYNPEIGALVTELQDNIRYYKNGQFEFSLNIPQLYGASVTCSPDLKWLIKSDQGNFDLFELKPDVKSPILALKDCQSFSFSEHFRLLALGFSTGAVALYSLDKKAFIFGFQLQNTKPHSLSFSPDGTSLLCGTKGGIEVRKLPTVLIEEL